MKFEHNQERDAFLQVRGKVVLDACPGSGKTTIVAYKLSNILETWEADYGKYFGVACLSFTNVAKDEINDKFEEFTGRQIPYPHMVSTLDSFVNRFITLPFYHLLSKNMKMRPRILDDTTFMDAWRFPFSVRRKRKEGVSRATPLHYIYRPSSIDLMLNGTFTSGGKAPSLSGQELELFNSYCKSIKKIQFTKGLLKNTDSAVLALCILKLYPAVANALVSRFPYIMIDEAQDTSEIQHAIIDELIKRGLNRVEVVGDPYQCLYEWREARPDLFVDRGDCDDWITLGLTRCRRSAQAIVDSYKSLRLRGTHDLISSKPCEGAEQQIRVLRYSDAQELLDRYKELSKDFRRCTVLVRGSSHLVEFGAKCNSLNLWKIVPALPEHLIRGQRELAAGRVKDVVRRVRQCVPAVVLPERSLEDQRQFLEEIERDPAWNARILELVSLAPGLGETVNEWTQKAEQRCMEILQPAATIDFQLKHGKYRKWHKRRMIEVFGDAPNGSFVMSIHSAKGMTFDSVMLVLSATSKGQSISFSDLKPPGGFPGEKNRLVYVAMSRPSDQLVLAVPQAAKATDEMITRCLGDRVLIEVL
ncbi:MAG: ATP-dependent helicase [bacterium]|nr:ATP-dependent helicase [bacterium]